MEDFDALLAQMETQKQELAAKLREIEAQATELRAKALEMKPAKITIVAFNPSNQLVTIKNDFRTDILNIFKSTEGRIWNPQSSMNAVPVASLEKLIENLNTLPRVTVEYQRDDVEKAIKEYLYAPNYMIDFDQGKQLSVKVKAGIPSYGIRDIPGADYKWDRQIYTVPLPEAWRLHQCLDGKDGVVWAEKASEFVIEQISRRATLDKIATAKDWDIQVPTVNATLRNFQRVGIAFFDNNGVRGILADEMGTGKTLQTIALAELRQLRTLVVVPASLKTNWVREIKRFTGAAPLVLYGATPGTLDIVNMIKGEQRFTIINYDIISRSFDHDKSYTDSDNMYHKVVENRWPWIEAINLADFDMVVLDEAHYIKNVDSQRSQAIRKLTAKHFISLTGTPVLNRPGELWPMLHMAAPETFPAYETFLRQYTWDGKSARNVDELRTLLKPLMIRRLKKDVVEDIPALNRITEYHDLSPRAKKLYDRALEGVYEVVSTWSPNEAGTTKNITNILTQIQRLKQIAAIDKVESTVDLATRIYDSSDPAERPKKVLIFSQYKATAYAIKVRLGHEAIGFVSRTAGGEFKTAEQKEQQELIDKFQSDPDIHYLVVTEKTAKEGHNITAAMAVVFNDEFWTPAAHQQAEGRAYMRMGDPHGIDSYYMVANGTIDEWVMELLDAKLRMIEEVVEGVESSRNPDESIAMDLIRKIKEGMWLK